eukprot:superscaffoldBa00002003_g12814
MAQWMHMTQLIQEDFVLEKVEQEGQAKALLDQIINMLQSMAQENANVVEKMKLLQISRSMTSFQQQPLQFGVMVRDMLRKERTLLRAHPTVISPPQYPQYRESSFSNMQDVDNLVFKVLEVQEVRQTMHQLQEELNWERQNYESIGTIQQNGLDPTTAEIQKLQNHIQQLEYKVKAMATKRFQLLKECVDCLDQCQTRLINRLKVWRWEQHKATIGHPFDDNLNLLQTWCEQLLGVNGKLRQELMLIGEPIPELQERLGQLLQVLIQSSLVVDKQPPQVIKTQSKFSTTVRYLLGEKVAPGKPVLLKAQIITELQARSLGSVPSDNVGELINNTAILEHNTASKSTCATFRNMSIKKIKRADRKGSESVTEEKFALLFSTEISITGCDTPYRIQMISLPVVVIVHGSQDNNALATIIWDCAFSEPDRVPFVVPERVPWKLMCSTLNSKFTSEVQTQHNLDQYNQHFLAQKIFDKPDFADDFSNMMVSWAQFNKEVLPGRPFTFWQWFEGVMDLTKKHLKTYWSDGLIFGFIGKQHLHLILKDRPNGTFLLRFSDSEIGGITIAYVSATERTLAQLQSLVPIYHLMLKALTMLFPTPFLLRTTVGTQFAMMDLQRDSGPAALPVPNMAPHAESPHNAVPYPMDPGSAALPVPNMAPHGESPHNAVPYPMHQFQQPFSPQESITQDQMETSASPSVDFNPNSPVVFPHDMGTTDNMDLVLDTLLKNLGQ